MKRIPKRLWLVAATCCLVAMVLAWGAAQFATGRVNMPNTAAMSGESAVSTRKDEGTTSATSATGVDDASSSAGDDASAQLEASEATDAINPDYEPSFVMPEDAEYVPDVVLILVAPDASVERINELLAETPAVAKKEVSADEVADGAIALDVAEGYTVEDAVNALAGAEELEGAQPDYLYYLQLGTARDLRARLAAADLEEPTLMPLDSQQVEGESSTEFDENDADEYEGAPEDAADQSADSLAFSDEDVADDAIQQDSPAEDAQGSDELVSPAEPLDAEQHSDDQNSDEKNPDATSDNEKDMAEPSLLEGLTTNDTSFSRLWALTSMNVPQAWLLVRSEGAVTVAVVDQSPDYAHVDLAENVVGTYDSTTQSTTYTTKGRHGTHVAGIISAVANNKKGVAGVSYNAGLLCITAFPEDGTARASVIARGIQYAANHAEEYNVRIINLSLGMVDKHSDSYIRNAITEAFENHDIIVVAAAGNADINNKQVPFYEYPGDMDCVVSVINLTRNSDGTVVRATDSNYNMPGQTAKNISAPGSSIYSTTINNSYTSLSGTSMASAEVSGALALILSAKPTLSASDAVNILYTTAKDLGDAGWDEQYGYGEVDAFAAVLAANPWDGSTLTVDETNCTYTGAPLTPATTLTLSDGTVLTEGTDYEVSYFSNTDAGAAMVTAVAKGSYEGRGFATAEFTINPASLESASLVLEKTSMQYTGAALKPGVTVRMGNTKLVAGTDYAISYTNNVNAGTATVTVTGRRNYQGTASKIFSITPASLAQASVTLEKTKMEFTGSPLEPGVTVKLGNATLVPNVDYTVDYEDNAAAGMATVVVTGQGNYQGSTAATFEIIYAIPFTDVDVDTAHVEDIIWLADQGISTGWPDGTFRPYNNVARADMAAFLFRLAASWNLVDGSWQPSGDSPFVDVGTGTAHYREIMWLAESGISKGWDVAGVKEFRPLAKVARADMAAFLFRLAALQGLVSDDWQPSGESLFVDVTTRTAHYREIMWLAETGISRGWDVEGEKEYRPFSSVARADMAAFLHRLDNL